MKHSKISALTATAIAVLTVLTGCASAPTDDTTAVADGQYRIAFANYSDELTVFGNLHRSFDELNTSGSGVTMEWYDNEGDASKMISNVKQMIQSQPDAIVLWPVSAATDGVSQLLERSGIPCVSINVATPACAFLNIDNAALGSETATLIAAQAKEKGWTPENTTVLIGQVAGGGDAINNCVKYFYSTLTSKMGWPEVTPDDVQPTTTTIAPNGFQFNGNNALQPAYEEVSNLAASIPKDNNVILYTSANDSNKGALQALAQAGFDDPDKILVGGLGGDETGLTALADDPSWVAEGDIFINYWGQYAVGLAQALIAGETPPAVTPLPQIVYGKDDLATYHPDGDTSVKELPHLVAENEFLADTPFFQYVHNVAAG